MDGSGSEGSPMFEGLDDEELLVLSAGRADAFGTFYERHAEALLRFFARRTLDPDAAAELTAETFAEAWVSRRGSARVGWGALRGSTPSRATSWPGSTAGAASRPGPGGGWGCRSGACRKRTTNGSRS